MAEYLLLLLVQITIFSTTTALCLLMIRRVFHCRIPPKLGMAMWLILLLRVVCPVFPESYLSIYNLIPAGKEIMFTLTYDDWQDLPDAPAVSGENSTAYEDDGVHNSESDMIETETLALSETGRTAEKTGHRFRLSEMILILYAAGVLLTAGIHFLLYQKAVRKLKRNISPCFDNRLERQYRDIAEKLHIRHVPELYMGESSMTVGYFRPIIVLRRSEKAGCKDNEMVLTHELNHYKHLDNQILLLSTVMCCIFWYNPMLWIVRKYLREDIELLCDMRTLGACDVESAEYARLLCRYSQFEDTRAAVGTPMSASGRRLKKRLMTIALHKQQRFLSRTTSILLTAAIVAVCLTNPIISNEHEYQVYIENYAALTGADEQDLYLEEHISIHEFLGRIESMLTSIGGENLADEIGSGSLEKLKRIAADSPYVDEELANEISRLQSSELLRKSNCVLLLNCISDLLRQDLTVEDPKLLPEMISVETFEKVCENLTPKQAELLVNCYNRGVTGVDISFNYLYSNAMMEQIMSRINDDWAKEKLRGYYTEIDLLPEQLDVLSNRLNETIRYVGIGTNYYICVPDIKKGEEEILRTILGAAVAGQREDVYYLKETEDGCSYETAELLFEKAGFTVADMYEEYARIGATAYTYITPEDYTVISEYDVHAYATRLSDPALEEAFRDNFTYHENFVYEGEDGTDLTVPFRYYSVNEENADACRFVMEDMLKRLNALSFPQVCEVETILMSGSSSETVREAAIQCIERGFLDMEEKMDMGREISSGQCTMILCRFLASMTNVSK
ncbi:MAG: M56 family metallopeptidase [Clostridia bacterium]|nr:M56 family metallopeptidase [Clostridia bacterium]